MNSLNLIIPYRYEGMWVFDDPRVGLDKEPFVAGADTMIDVLVAEIPGAEKGFRLLFSASPFPGHSSRLEWRREESGGNWYFSPEFKKRRRAWTPSKPRYTRGVLAKYAHLVTSASLGAVTDQNLKL